MTRKTVLFFCCFAALTTAPAWGDNIKVIYKCPTGQYAKGGSGTTCQTGYTGDTQSPAVYPRGNKENTNNATCEECPKTSTFEDVQYGVSDRRPAAVSDCYAMTASGKLTGEDEMGSYEIEGNCYYTGHRYK